MNLITLLLPAVHPSAYVAGVEQGLPDILRSRLEPEAFLELRKLSKTLQRDIVEPVLAAPSIEEARHILQERSPWAHDLGRRMVFTLEANLRDEVLVEADLPRLVADFIASEQNNLSERAIDRLGEGEALYVEQAIEQVRLAQLQLAAFIEDHAEDDIPQELLPQLLKLQGAVDRVEMLLLICFTGLDEESLVASPEVFRLLGRDTYTAVMTYQLLLDEFLVALDPTWGRKAPPEPVDGSGHDDPDLDAWIARVESTDA